MILIGQQPVTDSGILSAAERLSPVSALWPPTDRPSFLQQEKIFGFLGFLGFLGFPFKKSSKKRL